MPRIIDADELREKVVPYTLERGCVIGRHSGIADAVLELIDTAPTIDAEPVRHGTWIEDCGDIHSSGRVVICSLCHKQHFIPNREMSWWVTDESMFQKPDRCHHCGAKMDGVRAMKGEQNHLCTGVFKSCICNRCKNDAYDQYPSCCWKHWEHWKHCPIHSCPDFEPDDEEEGD